MISKITLTALFIAALVTVTLDVFVWRSTAPAIAQGAQ